MPEQQKVDDSVESTITANKTKNTKEKQSSTSLETDQKAASESEIEDLKEY